MIDKMNKFILDTLFPISCLGCGKEEHWLCQECFERINYLSSQICPFCEKETTAGGKVCLKCKSKFLDKNLSVPIDALLASASYKDKLISRLVHYYKYNFVFDLHEVLGEIVTRSFLKNDLAIPDYIVPVPLHPRRLRWRGFNQSELLASYLSQHLAPGFNIPVLLGLIIRKKYTSPQMKIRNYKERQENIDGVFVVGDKNICSNIKDKKILLIDDIATTGATLFECGRVLKAAGAKEVFGAVVARQEFSKK